MALALTIEINFASSRFSSKAGTAICANRISHRQREQLVRARKQLEAEGRSLTVNHGLEGESGWVTSVA
jgi:hypothetical protein